MASRHFGITPIQTRDEDGSYLPTLKQITRSCTTSGTGCTKISMADVASLAEFLENVASKIGITATTMTSGVSLLELSRLEGIPKAIEMGRMALKTLHQYFEFNSFDNNELPTGWEPDVIEYRVWLGSSNVKSGEKSRIYTVNDWPRHPIRNVEHLRAWLSAWLWQVHMAFSEASFWTDPKGLVAVWFEDVYGIDYGFNVNDLEPGLKIVRRELRNSRRAMRELGISLPTGFDVTPSDFFQAEQQLVLLIDGLPKPADEMPPEHTNRKRGRPKGSVTTDVEGDARIAKDWSNGTGKFESLEALAAELQKTVEEVKAALKRHTSRKKHSK